MWAVLDKVFCAPTSMAGEWVTIPAFRISSSSKSFTRCVGSVALTLTLEIRVHIISCPEEATSSTFTLVVVVVSFEVASELSDWLTCKSSPNSFVSSVSHVDSEEGF